MIMKRNLQQSDIIYNMVFDFAIHGQDTGQQFFKEITDSLVKYGDSVRLVGYNTKKPTARVNTTILYKSVFIPMEVLNQLPDTEVDEVESDTDSEDCDTSENTAELEGEDQHDKESN